MNACPVCKAKNQDSSLFCKKCGSKMSGSEFREKKEKVLGEKKKFPWPTAILVMVAVILGAIAYWVIEGETPANSKVSAQPRVAVNADYAGQKIPMTDLSPNIENGMIIIPLHVVLNRKLVRFEYEGSGKKVHMLSYITQAGRVVTAVSLCKSCQSTRFHINGKTLVCNSCETTWDLETLKGVSGSSVNDPPDIITGKVDQCCIQIDEKIVAQWKPKA